MRKRVVVTGLGCVTPLGVGVKTTWERLIAGESGIKNLWSRKDKKFEKWNDLPVKIAGFVDEDEWTMKVKKTMVINEKTMAPFIQYAMVAAEEALKDAQWHPTDIKDKEQTGVAIGSGIGGIEEITYANTLLNSNQMRRISPFFIPKMLVNMAAGHVSIRYGFQGPNHAVATACATGTNSIGDAMRFIQFGDADVMVAGSTESTIDPLSIIGFARAKALTTKFNDRPTEASRPFDKDRDGFVLGEGAGIIVLEELEHAKKRGAKIYAEVCGYGLSGDAYHITAPSKGGRGAYLAMERAIKNANMEIKDIDYINAHATSTPLGDALENQAIKSLLDDHAKNITVSSTKGAIGHLLGAAGAVESIFTILSIYHQLVPPTLNLHQVSDPNEFNLNYSALVSQKRSIHVALCNSFGFGGTNASLCFSKSRD